MYPKLLVIWILSIGITQAEFLFPTTERPTSRYHSYKACGQGRECVMEYLCVNGKVNRNGATLIDIRSHLLTEMNDSGPPSESTGESEENFVLTEDDNGIHSECRFLETCCFVGYKNETKKNLPSNAVRPVGEVSWIVLIYVVQAYLSSGTLISPKVVLTAGHRVQRKAPNRLRVRAGAWDYPRKAGRIPDQYRKVKDVAIHRQFDLYDLRNDVALLFLEEPFNVGQFGGILSLPPAGLNFDYSRCQLTGLIRTNGRYFRNIAKIESSIKPSNQCEANYRNSCLGSPWLFTLDSSHLCAIREDRTDARKPTIGSPLVCPMNDGSNSLFLAGILIEKVICRHLHVPELYGSVSQFRQWIDDQFVRRAVYT